jgi:hypothetical protein
MREYMRIDDSTGGHGSRLELSGSDVSIAEDTGYETLI